MQSGDRQENRCKPELTAVGPSAEIRTQGLLNPIQARYQTSPHPEVFRDDCP